MNNRERMHTGQLYDTQDSAIVEEQIKCLEVLYDFNATRQVPLRPSVTESRILSRKHI